MSSSLVIPASPRPFLALVALVALAPLAPVSHAEPGDRLASQDEAPVPSSPGPHPFGPTPFVVRSLRVLADTPVRLAPRWSAGRFGRIGADTRVAWKEVLADSGDAACGRWIAIHPRGFLCEREVAPSELEPGGVHQPLIRPGQIVPDRYDPAEFTSPPSTLSSHLVDPVGKRSCEPLHADQPTRTRERGDVSDFAGLNLACPDTPAFPFAWVQSRMDVKRPVKALAKPRADAPVTRTIAPRTLVSLAHAEHKNGFYALAPDQWVAASDLHIAKHMAPPPRTFHDEKWIDVDLDEQVLVAYEGTRPVYATLVATGTPSHPTPPRIFRIEQKLAAANMIGSDYRASVPWTMYLDGYYAVHSAYWHDRFGSRTSHGCINLPPLDARVLYHWAEPVVPPGWLSARGSEAVPGTLVRLRNRHRENPAFEGYAKDVYRARR